MVGPGLRMLMLLVGAVGAAAATEHSINTIRARNDQNSSPPSWGGVTQWKCMVNMTDPADSPENPNWTFKYTYDADAGVDLYEHGQGQADEACKVRSVQSGSPCQVLNAADGNTYVTSNLGTESATCCIFPIHVGAVKSDWLTHGGSYVRREMINGVETDVWTITGQYVNFYAASVDGLQRPVRYWEHKHGILKQWDFILETFQAAASKNGTFSPPDVCGDSAPTCIFSP